MKTTDMGRCWRDWKSPLMAVLLCVSGGAFAAGMSHADYSARKDQISADYKVDKAACDRLTANDKDVCVEKAKGKESVAKAELEYAYTGKDSDAIKISEKKADAAYAVAKEMCDDKKGNDKDVCVEQAKAAHTKAMADAKLHKKVGDAQKDATQDKRDADYKLAAEKCDSMSGDAKAACIKDAKARYGKS
ncbi:MAG TPA: hypothetical protein VJO99_11925 [Burkholderiaceae bacterium]|nr:hypothetical protein [Burkholderiaceae bacterium]